MKKWTILFSFLLFLSVQQVYAKDTTDHCPALTGQIIVPGDPSYDKARLVSNFYPSKKKYPRAIVYCQTTEDVQNAIKWARCNKVSIRIRSGGHNHEGFSTGTGVIIIDVSKMKKLELNKSMQVAVLQPGLTGKELYTQLFQLGYTQVGGTCSEVGISGLILTGGMGPLLRKHGIACDSLIAFDMVDANGNLIHATKNNQHKNLFWASCGGGGGNFGVVTQMSIKVYPAQSVTWFNIGWDWNQPIAQVINVWQGLFASDNRQWFSHLDVWAKAFPAKKFNKLPIKALGVFWGTPDEARQQLAPLLKIGHPIVTIESVNWKKAIELFEDSTSVFITARPEYKSTGAYAMESLPPEAVKIITHTLQHTQSSLLNVLLFSLGGAAQEIKPTDTAYFYRNAKFFIVYSTQWLKESKDKQQIKEVDILREKLLPYTQGNYIGNPDRSLTDYLTTYYGDNVAKLRCVKKQYDPENIFHFEQSIPPAPENWNCATIISP